jgi:hypothetical protein
MPSSGHGQESKDTLPGPPSVKAFGSYARASAKRPREDSDPESDSETDDNNKADMEQMDFQPTVTQHITETQALGDADDNPGYIEAELPPPLTPEHAALRADFQIITQVAMENLYNRITTDIKRSVDDTTMALKKTTNQLHGQILSLNARVSQLQQQVLTCQATIQRTAEIPMAAPLPTKKDPKKNKEKQNTNQTAVNATGNNGLTYAAVASTMTSTSTPTLSPTDNKGWTTLKVGGRKKKTTTPKLIPTIYPKAEREVSCYFTMENTNTTPSEQDHTVRQAVADIALRRVNSAFVDTKDVDVPPFIRARVTMRGAIVFTTSNCQNNVVYEDYSTIIAEALSYHGKCEKVEIGKRFSQFLLHGVPTHFSLPEISDSIATNYHQLIQVQTPRWLTPADRRENKTHSTIVMTLAGNIKKADIGRQHLIICNRECQLEEYIAYGRSTQCRNCQRYGHPAALCHESPRCAVCASPHETKDHPCNLPACKKGPTCTHPPIHCANCDTPHKASDPNCPERIKLRTYNKATAAANQGDAPMAGVAE